ncbi:MAG: energy-coupling factor transporter transmembrane protein EcfT [Deltaproteobacteria bacterium]|nr:energy-coupling factor transporter transmembrane protein EcfT [Deltaproteobacteria bacterium]
MPLFLYLDRRTFVHRRHPLVKVLGMLLFFIAAFVVDHPLFILPISLGMFTLIWLTDSVTNLRRLRILFFFIFTFTIIIWSVFYGRGSPLAMFPDVPVTREGMMFGLGTALKLSTFLATGILFLSTTRIEEFAYAFTLLGLPYRIGFTITLAFRLVPLFLEAAFTVIQAQRCRGLDMSRGPLLQRLRHYVFVMIPVFMGALRRADQMAVALEVRGFNSGRTRTSYQRVLWNGGDTLALFTVFSLAVLYVYFWRLGYGRIPVLP